MLARDRQLAIAVIQETAAQQPGIDPKIAAARACLIATSQRLAELKIGSFSTSSSNLRAADGNRSGFPAAHSSRWVSSSSFIGRY